MKKIYLISILLFLLFKFGTAQIHSTQYFDGEDTLGWIIEVTIDTSSNNIWQIGRPQKTIFDSAATQPNVIVTDTIHFYPINNTSSFVAKVKLFSFNYGIFALQWMQKLDMDTSFDGGIIEYSIDNGATWVNVFNNPYVYNFYGFQPANQDTLASGEFAFSGTDSTWRDIWLCFSMSWLQQTQDSVSFKFTFKSDSMDNNKEGWMIDNLISHLTIYHTVKESEKDNHLKLFPNPASGVVHVEAEKLLKYHIIEKMELIDPLGRVIDYWTNIPTKFWFDTKKYIDGLYYLKVKTNFKSETIPLIISKH